MTNPAPASETQKERITHAAIKAEVGGMIFLGKSHSCCFQQARNSGFEISRKAKDQGFVTNHGRFVGREEAAKIAFEWGQIASNWEGGILLSENLWHPNDGGKFKYDSVKGYYL